MRIYALGLVLLLTLLLSAVPISRTRTLGAGLTAVAQTQDSPRAELVARGAPVLSRTCSSGGSMTEARGTFPVTMFIPALARWRTGW